MSYPTGPDLPSAGSRQQLRGSACTRTAWLQVPLLAELRMSSGIPAGALILCKTLQFPAPQFRSGQCEWQSCACPPVLVVARTRAGSEHPGHETAGGDAEKEREASSRETSLPCLPLLTPLLPSPVIPSASLL